MKNIELEQNTLAWHEHRRKYINASEVATIMGLNPFETKEQLLKRKLFNLKIEDNPAMQRGRLLEPKARLFFNQQNQFNFNPKVFVKDFMSASLDGWDDKTQNLLEIKCPFSLKNFTWRAFFQEDKVPLFYYAQIQAQIYCSEACKAYFFVYQSDDCNKVKEIQEDDAFIKDLVNQCRLFFQMFQKSKQLQEKLQIAI
ncbi:Similar to phage-related protein predicted endonuclease [Candidatus Phytoplasma australiense]|uniref:YqaJ viral recombinase domain-containing protein n=2 Tax=Phytoplasma australiense TaxID=59748 RepID=R4S0R1_PHYAS|nr:YqaJ viral recombinase family protein [Candidatus Phytoplasma australiense]AGL90348.1 hypothetical protein SLY_0428 [Strawberry lethal yellows phytoplasma (CPA) str. NZSb11]CAM11953.1 Similar to phage-related protein predicted endonuclease [Candidatus Phytoplasma australiense]